MSEHIRESLSALIDGEASELEIERVLSQLRQTEVRETWRRYQMSRMALRAAPVAANLDVSVAVRDALMAPDGAEHRWAPARRFRFFVKQILQPVAGFAVAASAFAAVLIGSQLYGLPGADSAASGRGSRVAARVSPVGMVNTVGGAALTANYRAPATKSGAGTQRAAYNRLAREQLRRYMLPHTDEATLNSPRGMMPYARLAGLPPQE